jgi:hypothetical protein
MTFNNKIKKAIFGYDIFISYSRMDGLDYAYAVAQYFMKKGYECYIDQLTSVMPGKELPPNIKDAVKRSTAFVLIGSDGTHLSEPIANEIDLFLNDNKNKPLIPITIEGSINTNATWYNKILGLPLIEETKQNLQNAVPAADVLNRIENSLTFKKKSKKLRQTSISILIIGILLSGFLVYQKMQNLKEVKRTQINLLHAAARDYYIKRDYSNALIQLVEISKIGGSEDSTFNFFEEGVLECMSKDSFLYAAKFLQKTSELFSIVYPQKFKAIHFIFLLSEIRGLIKNFNPVYLQGADSVNNIIACALNKIYSYPEYKDSVENFIKNEYYPPLSMSTYYTPDSYKFGNENHACLSPEQDMVSWIGRDSIHVNMLTGKKFYSEKKASNSYDTSISLLFSNQDSRDFIILYTPSMPNLDFSNDSSYESKSVSEDALDTANTTVSSGFTNDSNKKSIYCFLDVYSNGKRINRLYNASFISINQDSGMEKAEEISIFDFSLDGIYFFDSIKNNTIFVKVNKQDSSRKRLFEFCKNGCDNYNTFEITIEGSDKKSKLFGKKDSLMVLDGNDKVQKIISIGDWLNDDLIYSGDSSLILISGYNHNQNHNLFKVAYLMDSRFNYYGELRFCSKPIFVATKYILDLESQSLWFTNPVNLFSEYDLTTKLTKEQKRRYGIEFN